MKKAYFIIISINNLWKPKFKNKFELRKNY